jgi:hypothetical protein
MTAVLIEDGRQPRPVPVPVVLGMQEGMRILRHPISLVGAAVMIIFMLTVGDNGPGDAFGALSTGPTFFGVFTYFAANLVASRDRRAHTGELLTATPAPRPARVAALCVGALVPTLAAVLFVVVVHAMHHARGLYEVAPGFFHLVQGPLAVLGAALLGIMVARLAGVPGAALLVMVAMFAWNIWTSNDPGNAGLLGTAMSWVVYSPNPGWHGLYPGSPGWHDAYLLGLCAMAATGAFLREAAKPRRVLALGTLLTALTAVPAYLQLP